MTVQLENVLPRDIEKRSFEIIGQELGRELDPEQELIIKRCIHTSADFDYADNLKFSENAVQKAMEAIKKGAVIVTDTQMAKSGINKRALARYGGEVLCFMSDEDVAAQAKANGTTRATACIDKAAKLDRPVIFAIGNAPTALVRIYELIEDGKLDPELIIGVPVGFVNVVQSKELIMSLKNVPYIVAAGRKGGSNIAACIVNALLYKIDDRRD
ncbi:MAG: precorrin-8X methylmutase [Lachnospiraceae bacterium]|nr:precorrin-8X methylmutase [Lachnospiraceae bacterium]